MKILIIPDVHGRDFWIEPCNHIDEFDKVIFLGDYHDPYSNLITNFTPELFDKYKIQLGLYDDLIQAASLDNLKNKLYPFIKQHENKVICLLGNHDCSYLNVPVADRFDYDNQDEIREILQDMNLKLLYKVDNYLFSHAGVLPLWLNRNQLTLDYLLNEDIPYVKLDQVSQFRGGLDPVGSCVWCDAREYMTSIKLPELYQIFGHTQLQQQYITSEFACLDCQKAFTLDTETKILTEFKNESKSN